MTSLVISVSGVVFNFVEDRTNFLGEETNLRTCYASMSDSEENGDYLTILSSSPDVHSGDLKLLIDGEEVPLPELGEIVEGTVIDITEIVESNEIPVGSTYIVTLVFDGRVGGDYTFYGETPNSPPEVPTSPSPEDGATQVSLSPTLIVTVVDPDNDELTVSFYDSEDDSLIGTDTGVPSETSASVVWSGLSYGTTYSWYVIADDGESSTQSEIWSFQTQLQLTPNNPPDEPTNPSPSNEAVDVELSPTLSIDVSDPDEDELTVSFYDGTEDAIIGTATEVQSGTTASVLWSTLEYETLHIWYVVVSDGEFETSSAIFSFTTIPAPNTPPELSTFEPEDEAIKVRITADLSWECIDEDVVTFDVYFGTGSTRLNLISDDQFETSCDPGNLQYSTTYYWKIVAFDGTHTVTSSIMSFTTQDGISILG